MGNKKNLRISDTQNLVLRSFNSVQIGLYLLLFAFILKSLLDGFLSDVSMLGMMSIEIIENVGLTLVILFILFSGLAVFFSSRRRLRKLGQRIWNKPTRNQLLTYYVLCILAFVLLFTQKNSGISMYLPVAFLFYFGLILVALNNKKKKPLYLLAGICIVLALLSFLIPSYWYSAMLIVGIAFVVYGIMIKK